jgi:predicted nucleic acid-binding protein
VIFVDTSFWVAEAYPRDRRHDDAGRLALARSTERLVTSNLVLGETWTFLRRRTGHQFAFSLLDVARASGNVATETVDPNLEDEAWRWLRVHDERPYSFLDATSFALMRKLRITDALAFDGDFAAAGFVELRP